MNGTNLLSFLVMIIVAGLVFWLLVWLIDWIGLPEPFNKVAKVVVGVAAVLYLLGVLTGHAPRLTI